MSEAERLQAEQHDFWNGPGGAKWVAHQDHTDRVLAPILDALLPLAEPRPGERVLDIGCGCGASTLALAERVGAAGHVTGLDVSAPMLAVARRRGAALANVDWRLADAATETFDGAGFHLLASRFGVMFFGDPHAAFANLRRALRPGGRLGFVCWRAFAENPWMQVPLEAVYAAGVPPLPQPPDPHAPGPFAFAEADRVAAILTAAGFTRPRLEPHDLLLDLAAGAGLDAAATQASEIGAAGRALADQPQPLREAAVAAIRAALAPHAQGGRVALPGAVWLVSAAA